MSAYLAIALLFTIGAMWLILFVCPRWEPGRVSRRLVTAPTPSEIEEPDWGHIAYLCWMAMCLVVLHYWGTWQVIALVVVASVGMLMMCAKIGRRSR